MRPTIYVFGDIEIGGGTLTDDFIADRLLCKTILAISCNRGRVDLVLNGDTFDFLKCPYIKNGVKTYPRHITAEISLRKLELMYQAHLLVFSALRTFVSNSHHRIYFNYGNHDPDLTFAEVQKKLKQLLGNSTRIYFDYSYNLKGVHVEHGHLYDFLHKLEKDKDFLMYRGKKILNLPFVSFGLITHFMTLKEEHPFMERIKARPILFEHEHKVSKRIRHLSASYFLKSVMYYPLRHFRDPTYRLPRGLFDEFVKRFREQHWDVDHVAILFKEQNREKLSTLRSHNIYVLGHTHDYNIDRDSRYVILHPDTWRDEYILSSDLKDLVPKRKSYVKIVPQGIGWSWRIISVTNKRSIISFKEGLAQEHACVARAAEEEGYEYHLLV